MLIAVDRGLHVRKPEDYRRLVSQSFDVVDWQVSNGLLRVPYDHLIMTCRK